MTDQEFRKNIHNLLVPDGRYIVNPVSNEQVNNILYQNLLHNIMKHGYIWLKFFAYNGNT